MGSCQHKLGKVHIVKFCKRAFFTQCQDPTFNSFDMLFILEIMKGSSVCTFKVLTSVILLTSRIHETRFDSDCWQFLNFRAVFSLGKKTWKLKILSDSLNTRWKTEKENKTLRNKIDIFLICGFSKVIVSDVYRQLTRN